jgi:hypothetical protein
VSVPASVTVSLPGAPAVVKRVLGQLQRLGL